MKKNQSTIYSSATKNQRQYLLTPNSPFAIKEAYVKLRTNLMFSITKSKERECTIFAITSPNPGEGKSTTAANIAISFALLGKKTLLIDTDLRKPCQHKLWSIPRTTGISDYLAKIDDCPSFTVDSLPLSIIIAGSIPPNPSELLSSNRLSSAIEYLSEKFDYIIFDTPPINTVADAQIISQLVDGVVLVLQSSFTTDYDARQAKYLIEQSGGNFCGFILNEVNMKASHYSYRYGKKRYGYGNKYETAK